MDILFTVMIIVAILLVFCVCLIPVAMALVVMCIILAFSIWYMALAKNVWFIWFLMVDVTANHHSICMLRPFPVP